MPSPRQPPDALQEFLDEAESELSRRLREACEAEARGVSTNDVAEIRHLEDTLLSAAMAAEQAIAARRHMQRGSREETARAIEAVPLADGAPTQRPEAPGSAEVVADGETPVSSLLREFADSSGRQWRAWPVKPGMARSDQAPRPNLGVYQDGWICFEALDDSARRRLPGHEPRWSELPARELESLLERAIDAPGRKPKPSEARKRSQG